MPDFFDAVKGLPFVKDLPADTTRQLIREVVKDVQGAHNWPFLKAVDREVVWTANTAVMEIQLLARIIDLKWPNASSEYVPLTFVSDTEFNRHIARNQGSTTQAIWRYAGVDGNKTKIEIYAVPTTSRTAKIDYVVLPEQSNIEQLPSRFNLLVIDGVKAHANPDVNAVFGWERHLQRAIAREESLTGRRNKMGQDQHQAGRRRNIHDPG